MALNLKFRHKILLAAGLTVVFAFALFVLLNDYQQRKTLRVDAERSMGALGALTTSNIQTWLRGHMTLSTPWPSKSARPAPGRRSSSVSSACRCTAALLCSATLAVPMA